MKIAVNSVRLFVGILFIVSGLVKANDPLGLSYKMQEFFEVWNTSLTGSGFFAKQLLINLFTFLHDHSLGLSVFIIGLEIMAGVALILGWYKRWLLNLLLLLILFFTFLTAYAYWSGKFKNCGCFGDCLPITPLTSFLKDVLLLIMILFLIAKQQYIVPWLNNRSRNALLVTSLFITIFFQWYVLNYLPVVDCLPFKVGNNITEKMKIPANAIQDSFAMKFVYEREGKRYDFSIDELPADLENYKFIDREQKLIRKGNAEPPIKGFSLTTTGGADSTQAILSAPKALLVLFEDFSKPKEQWIGDLKKTYQIAQQKNIPIYIISPRASEAAVIFNSIGFTNAGILSADNTAVKTAARTNPTVFVIESGTITGKKSYRQMDQLIPLL